MSPAVRRQLLNCARRRPSGEIAPSPAPLTSPTSSETPGHLKARRDFRAVSLTKPGSGTRAQARGKNLVALFPEEGHVPAAVEAADGHRRRGGRHDGRSGMRGQGVRHSAGARLAAAHRRRPARQHGPAARGSARRACGGVHRTGRARAAGHRRGRQRPARTSPSRCSTATPANWSPTAARHHRHRLGGQALHRRRPAAAGVQGPDAALPRRPCGVRPDAAVVRRQRGGDVLEPQRRQRDHQPRRRPLRVDVDPRAEQRAVVQHHQHGRPTWSATTT